MYAGISGMKNFQTKLDVIGNNIANVNTSGFKKGRVTFQDMMSQTTSGAQGPTATRGGINPSQVGLGSQLGSIDNIHTQGFRQTTNRPLDLALEGDGMFVLASDIVAGAPLQDSNISYTRAGNFYLDSAGAVVNSQGFYLVGFDLDASDNIIPGQYTTITIPDNAQSFSVQTDGVVNYIDANGDPQVAGQIALASFSNASGLQKIGSNLFQESPNSGVPVYTVAETGGTGSMVAGSLEMSNVDLAEEFTEMIVAQRGFQANTRIISTSDEILQELVNLKR
jgi:flagellar hook protein FlgE